MKMDRNENEDGLGKYALVLLRKLRPVKGAVQDALSVLEREGLLDWGTSGTPAEFFLVRLKDRSAEAALRAYADDAMAYDAEWAQEVYLLADRAMHHPSKKTPD